MAKEDYKGIWIFAEQQNGELNPVSLELLAKAQELKGDACAGGIGVKLLRIPYGARLLERLHDIQGRCISRAVYLGAHGHESGELCPDALGAVLKSAVAHDPAVLNINAACEGDLRNAEVCRCCGTGLCRISVNRVASEQQQVIVADLLGRLCQSVSGSKGVGAAECAVREQISLVTAQSKSLFEHILGLRGTHA